MLDRVQAGDGKILVLTEPGDIRPLQILGLSIACADVEASDRILTLCACSRHLRTYSGLSHAFGMTLRTHWDRGDVNSLRSGVMSYLLRLQRTRSRPCNIDLAPRLVPSNRKPCWRRRFRSTMRAQRRRYTAARSHFCLSRSGLSSRRSPWRLIRHRRLAQQLSPKGLSFPASIPHGSVSHAGDLAAAFVRSHVWGVTPALRNRAFWTRSVGVFGN